MRFIPSSLMVKKQDLPGDLALWILILAELGVFSLFFVSYSFVRLNNLEMFAEGYHHLNRVAGLINTLALITSSYFVVRAVIAIKEDDNARCTFWLRLAFFMACIYVGVKGWEYYETIGAGYTLHTNTFYMFYFLLTFFHFAHVLLGMTILLILANKTKKGDYCANNHSGIESGASYWHMVDLLWIVLFPLVYVIH